MLTHASAFPAVGSWALLIDTALAPADQRAELVCIVRLDRPTDPQVATVTFPLRCSAGATKATPIADLIDGTPLSPDEQAELAELSHCRCHLTAKTAGRLATLQRRATWSVLLTQRLRDAAPRKQAA